MINWKLTKNERPIDGQMCFITQERTGLLSAPIIGPINYQKSEDIFLDLFASAEAGTLYQAGKYDLWWCDEDDLNLPDSDTSVGNGS